MMKEERLWMDDTIWVDSRIPAPVLGHIRYVIDSMMGHANLSRHDRSDLAQEMLIDVYRAIPKLTSKDGVSTGTAYLNKTVDMVSARIYRNRIKRGLDCAPLPLDVDNCDGDGNEYSLIDELSIADAYTKRRQEEIRTLVDLLPEDLRQICKLIMQGFTLAEIARRLGVSPETIRLRRLDKIQKFFTEHGMNRRILHGAKTSKSQPKDFPEKSPETCTDSRKSSIEIE